MQAVSKIFLSCDLTGSTAFKQRGDHNPQSPWQKALLQFYREFPQKLGLVSSEFSEHHDLQFNLWKAVGDELIFTCDLSREVDVYWAINIWIKTMQEYARESLSDKNLGISGGPKLGVKGGTFIATFPGPDSESSIPRTPEVETTGGDVVELNEIALKGKRSHKKYLFDYFGPSIDTGFRVLSKCDSRHFILSLEVAYVLAVVSSLHTRDNFAVPNLVLKSSEGLKGVWGGERYPLFALDLGFKDPVNSAFSAFEASPASMDDILALCRTCYESENWPFMVYLPGSQEDGMFKTLPNDPLSEYVRGAENDSVLADGEDMGAEEVLPDAPTS